MQVRVWEHRRNKCGEINKCGAGGVSGWSMCNVSCSTRATKAPPTRLSL